MTKNTVELEISYQSIINPLNFIKIFKDAAAFRLWCEEGSKEDLRCTLKAFEEAELYEHCAIINKVLKVIT
jgi:hypothetical protein